MRVLRAAEQACRNHNHYYVGVEHLLLALLDEDDASIAVRSEQLGIHRAELQAELRRSLGTGDDRQWEGILVTPRLRRLVETTEQTGKATLEPIDLFNAIVAQQGGLVTDVIARVSGNISASSQVSHERCT